MNSTLASEFCEDEVRCVIDTTEARECENLISMVESLYPSFSSSSSLEESDIIWLGREYQSQDNDLLARFEGYINKICGTEIFKEKEIQYTVLNQCLQFAPEMFKFHPVSYTLPKDLELLREDDIRSGDSKSWIAKPSEGLNGNDIFVVDTMEELMSRGIHDGMVVQHYINNPLLLKNRKWDTRVYVIIHGINPMKAYVSLDTGLARFCTEDYDPNDFSNQYANITNTAINCKHPNYAVEVEGEEDSDKVYGKYKLGRIWDMIKEEYPEADIGLIKDRFKEV